MTQNTTTTVLLADDHQIIRQGLASLLRGEGDVRLVGEAASGEEAVRLAAERSPDVVLMDIRLGGDVDGVEATRRVREAAPGTRVLALTASCEDRAAREVLRAGASGIVLKGDAFEELALAIRAVAAGRAYFSPAVTRGVVAVFADVGPAAARLSPREREVLQAVAEGLATKQVARRLHVSVKTVETHRRNVMEKLELYSVAELTKWAIREGLTTADLAADATADGTAAAPSAAVA